ncbi:MAG: cation-translocating P-type ATPase [Thermodesulfobacteriota bacterium]
MNENTSLDESPNTSNWHALNYNEVIEKLQTNSVNGLSFKEAEARLKQYGPNVLLTFHKTTWYSVLARQFINVLIFILLVAAAISLAIGELGDAITIIGIVLLNAILGFIQEWKAEKAIEALKKMLEPTCSVIRENGTQTIDARNIVPGDVVLLETGDSVPADLRVIEQTNLKIDESSLTGESASVNKSKDPVFEDVSLAEKRSIAWMGTSVTNGRATGVVVATGMSTEFGRIAKLTETVGRELTPLQKKLGVLGKQLGIIAVLISLIVVFAGLYLGKSLIEMFLTGVALAVAVVPEGLPAVVTITLALGIRAMVKRRALLRRLQAGETLGSATVICTDKTGTLTQNQMTVQNIWLPAGELEVTGVGYNPKGHFNMANQQVDPRENYNLLALLETGLKCNHAHIAKDESDWYSIGEPTEAALVVAANKAGLHVDKNHQIISEFSFNSVRKRMTVIEHLPDCLVAYVKGAPEIILERCTTYLIGDKKYTLTNKETEIINSAYQKMAEKGLRILALARRKLPKDIVINEENIENELTFLGIVGIIDPPRPEVSEAVRLASSAGIKSIMITGDAAPTALAIAKKIGMQAQIAITGREVNNLDDYELRETLNKKVLFARTTPEDKLRIVNLLQKMGHVVGMTGDGVNDAPALKKADIGIAMGLRGTEVARGASDMVLTDDNFASIIGAVEEGRRQYDNIQKFVRYLLSSNMAEVIAIFINIIIGGPLILLPVQILWMNLVTDGMTAVALGLESPEKGIMERPPRNPKEPILNRSGITKIVLLGGYMAAVTLLLYHHYLSSNDLDAGIKAQTVAFTGLIILEKINVFNFRALKAPLSVIGYFSNPWLIIAWGGTIGLQVCAVYVPFLQDALHTVPLSLSDWLTITIVAIPIFLVFETYKIISWSRDSKKKI